MNTDPVPHDDHTLDFDAGPVSELGGLTEFVGLEGGASGRDRLVGAKLGDVTVLRFIAEGGMGLVYEGCQGRPQRTVAVKVMRPGVVSPGLMRRFEYEAEMLGRLAHPGIAQIYTVGSQHIGGAIVPYFVMEFIPDAESLTEYVKYRSLTLRDRVTLFRKACEAVAYGHQKGIIHRDLKPSNILVDAKGEPKVIDFGVARSTDADVAMTTMHTDPGQLVGTLQYMCPEQFNADSNDIDVRADVYALGVVLWELVTGDKPYDIRHKPVFEVARIVREVEPALPRGATGSHHRDILLIARKCLEKDRNKRYSHASDLVDDIDRYLRGEVVSASAPTLIDALVRIARKHRIAAAAFAGVFAAMLLAIVGITSFYVEADRERAWADKQRRKAQLKEAEAIEQRQDSEKVLRFLVQTFQLPRTQSAGRDVNVRELLEMARTNLEREYGDSTSKSDLVVKANILAALGSSLLGIGSPVDAKRCLEESLQQFDAIAAQDTSDKASCMNELGLALHATGDYAEAKEMLQSALSMKERLLGAGHIDTAVVRSNLGFVLTSLGAYEDASRLLEQSRDACERALGPKNASVGTILSNLGQVRYRQGNYTEAESLLTAAAAIHRKIYGSDHSVAALYHDALGDVYRCTGRYADAAESYAKARALDLQLLNGGNPQVASTLSKLGELHRVQQEYGAAKPLLEEALAIREKAGLGDHPETAVILHRLGLVHAAEGRPQEAERLLVHAIAIRDKRLGQSHPDTITAVSDLARLYRDIGDVESADAMEGRLRLSAISNK